MTGAAKIGKESSQKAPAKKEKSMLDVVKAVEKEISNQYPGFSSYDAIRLAKLLAENKDIIK